MNTNNADGPALLITTDCAGLNSALSGHNFGSIVVNTPYEWDIFVTNTGSVSLYLYYEPTLYTSGGGQTAITVTVKEIEYGPQCETTGTTYALTSPVTLPEKTTFNGAEPSPVMLTPNTECKLAVFVEASSLDAGQTITVPLVISGATITISP